MRDAGGPPKPMRPGREPLTAIVKRGTRFASGSAGELMTAR
jgi:hypothetical protein